METAQEKGSGWTCFRDQSFSASSLDEQDFFDIDDEMQDEHVLEISLSAVQTSRSLLAKEAIPLQSRRSSESFSLTERVRRRLTKEALDFETSASSRRMSHDSLRVASPPPSHAAHNSFEDRGNTSRRGHNRGAKPDRAGASVGLAHAASLDSSFNRRSTLRVGAAACRTLQGSPAAGTRRGQRGFSVYAPSSRQKPRRGVVRLARRMGGFEAFPTHTKAADADGPTEPGACPQSNVISEPEPCNPSFNTQTRPNAENVATPGPMEPQICGENGRLERRGPQDAGAEESGPPVMPSPPQKPGLADLSAQIKPDESDVLIPFRNLDTGDVCHLSLDVLHSATRETQRDSHVAESQVEVDSRLRDDVQKFLDLLNAVTPLGIASQDGRDDAETDDSSGEDHEDLHKQSEKKDTEGETAGGQSIGGTQQQVFSRIRLPDILKPTDGLAAKVLSGKDGSRTGLRSFLIGRRRRAQEVLQDFSNEEMATRKLLSESRDTSAPEEALQRPSRVHEALGSFLKVKERYFTSRQSRRFGSADDRGSVGSFLHRVDSYDSSRGTEASAEGASNSPGSSNTWRLPETLRRRGPSRGGQIPHRIPVRCPPAKEQQCLSNLWLIRQLRLPESIPIWSLAISPDGLWIAAGAQDGTLKLWRMRTQSERVVERAGCGFPSEISEDRGQSQEGESTLETTPWTGPGKNDGLSGMTSGVVARGESSQLVGSDSQLRLWTPSRTHPQNVFDTFPCLTLIGHTAAIVTCQWDPEPPLAREGSNRIASASLDRTVRVWTVRADQDGRQYHCVIVHCADWATSACFHPLMKDLLYTGALDGTVQVWRIPADSAGGTTPAGCSAEALHSRAPGFLPFPVESAPENVSVKFRRLEMLEFMHMTELVTAMSVSPNGQFLAVGLRLGRVSVYEAKTLRFHTEIECRNRKGKYASGRKVTGLVWTADSASLCVTTNDSRLRIISLNDISSWQKFKGHTTTQMMLYAQFSPAEQHLICGSETSWIFAWNIHPSSPTNPLVSARLSLGKTKRPTNGQAEKFKAFNELLTACVTGNEAFSTHLLTTLQHTPIMASNRMSPPGGIPPVEMSDNSSGWEALQRQIRMTDSTRSSALASHGASLYGLTIIAGNYKGCVNIYLNLGHPVPTLS